LECVAQLHALELAPLHQTIPKMAHMPEMHTALQEAQW
jgi:hypothetical protein